ncbi:hypothetical protein HYW58_02225 [Candidatus Kaiserbacteria bacterium]|nr:hypothetical protein [Candidatus Kaiserbacteria bacterium]
MEDYTQSRTEMVKMKMKFKYISAICIIVGAVSAAYIFMMAINDTVPVRTADYYREIGVIASVDYGNSSFVLKKPDSYQYGNAQLIQIYFDDDTKMLRLNPRKEDGIVIFEEITAKDAREIKIAIPVTVGFSMKNELLYADFIGYYDSYDF